MSRMYKRGECAAWIAEAREARWHTLPDTHPLSIARCAEEQHQNCERIARFGGPACIDVAEYRECIAMLRAASH